MPYLVAAVGVTALGIGGYLAYLRQRLRELRADLDTLDRGGPELEESR